MRYKMVIAYDGTHFYGWQKQCNKNSIQESIEKVLSQIFDETIEIVASGRTDRGVHAYGQVVHFDGSKSIACDKLKYALNNYLPHSIRIQTVEVVDETFHARFSACKKTYQYVFTYDKDNPFVQNYKTILQQKLDIHKMIEASKVLIGEHDFTSFTSAKIDSRKSRVKTIYAIDIQQAQNDIVITMTGNGFLRYMVRMLCAVLKEIGSGNLTKQELITMLHQKDKHCCRYKAQSQGLYLVEVIYGG